MDEQHKLLTIFTPDWQSRLMLITSDMPTTVPTEQFLKSLPKHMLDSDPPPPQQPQPQYNNTNPNPPGYHKRLNKHRNSDGNSSNTSSGGGFPPPSFCQQPLQQQQQQYYVVNANLLPLGNRPPSQHHQQQSPKQVHDAGKFFNNNKTMHGSFNSPMHHNQAIKRPRLPLCQSPPQQQHKFDGPVFMASSIHHHLPKPPQQQPLTEMVNEKYKTSLCKKFADNGGCKYGNSCLFAHGTSDLRSMKYQHYNNQNQATRNGSSDTQ